MLWRTAFSVFALRLRALASLLLAVERRRTADPKAQDYADFQSAITAGICDQRNGVRGQFARQQSWVAHVRFGSKADIEVECAPNGGHLAGMELTKAAGLSEDESHGQTTFP